MGIKEINKFLEKNNIECFRTSDINRFAGKTIAIDCGVLFMRVAARVHKGLIRNLKNPVDSYNRREFFNELMVDILSDIFFFIKHRCNVIMVLDGPNDPDKDDCREERHSKKENKREEIRVLIEEYELALENPLEYGLPDEYEKKIRNLRANDFYFDKSYLKEIKKTFTNLGIPFLEAIHDAEFLCCSLVESGFADTVYTTDTDCYAFGINYIITSINVYRDTLEIVDIRHIVNFFMEELEVGKKVAKRSLKDFCIMCGCDFNKRTYGIGTEKSFKLIKEHKRFFNIPNTNGKFDCLNYELCKRKFTPYSGNYFDDIGELNIDLGKFINCAEELVDEYNSQDLSYALRAVKNAYPHLK